MTITFLDSSSTSKDFLAIEKVAGRVVHGPGSLLEEVRDQTGCGWRLVHRLDRMTSGVLLLAKDKSALRTAHAAWHSSVSKTYRACVRGIPEPDSGTIGFSLMEYHSSRPELLFGGLKACYGKSDALRLMAGERIAGIPELPLPGRTAVHPAGRPAVTDYRTIQTHEGTALLELVPHQGRMHQIRVHLAHIGHPVLGDPIYGAPAPPSPPFLHCFEILWREPPGGGPSWCWQSHVLPGLDWEKIPSRMNTLPAPVEELLSGLAAERPLVFFDLETTGTDRLTSSRWNCGHASKT